MFEQIESYQPITITIEASYACVLRLMTVPFSLFSNDFSLLVRRLCEATKYMTFSLCFASIVISNHIQDIKILLFHDPHFRGKKLFPFHPYTHATET